MTNIRTNGHERPYYGARIARSEMDAVFSSRDGAAERTYIDRRKLGEIENGTVTPSQQEVIRMAEAYDDPSLYAYYCANECPLGRLQDRRAAKGLSLSDVSVRYRLALKELQTFGDVLFSIALDGKISNDDEAHLAKEIATYISDLEALKHELELHMHEQGRRNT